MRKKSILLGFSKTNPQQITHKCSRCSAISITTTTTVGRKTGKHIESRKTDLLQTHPGERNSIGGFRPFQTPNSGFLFSSFFSHRPGTPVKSFGIKGNAALNDGPKVCYIYQSITHHEGGIFTSCFLILLSIIEGGVFA